MSMEATPDAPPASMPADVRRALEVLEAGAAQVLPEGGLAERLLAVTRERRPLRVKLGIDPSAPFLTLGHAVVLRKLRQFQDQGHLAVLIVGDFTGRVGDPSGKSSTRAALSAEDTARNAEAYFAQLMKVLDPDRVEIRYNSEWLEPLTMADVLKESRHLTVARLLEREDFARRFRDGVPISLMEFLYPLLQGYDSVAVRADVELGGTDQTYNNLVGRELQRAHGQTPQVVLTMPILEGLDGVEKMGKSLANWVAVDEPPGEQFGKLMSIPDHLVGRYARLCTDLAPSECDEAEAEAAAGGPRANGAKRRVARRVVALYHGSDAATEAEAGFDRQFRLREVPDDVPEYRLPDDDPVHLPALLRAAGLASSTSEARRLIDEGAVRVGGERLPAGGYDLPRARLAGQVAQRGRRAFVRLVG